MVAGRKNYKSEKEGADGDTRSAVSTYLFSVYRVGYSHKKPLSEQETKEE